MPLYKPSELIAFLTSIGVQPKRTLSQNFLIDGNVLEKIVAVAQVHEGVHVLEIGPGPGVLTERLLEIGCRVIAIEKDDTFAKALTRFPGQLTVIHNDVLEVNFTDVANVAPLSIVANIPYHIASSLLKKILAHKQLFSTATLLVSDDIASALTAGPRTKNYTALTVWANMHATVQICFPVSPHCFYPRPRAASSVIQLTMNSSPHVPFALEILEVAFQHRRKMLTSSLAKFIPKPRLLTLLQSLGLPATSRPDELTPEQWRSMQHGFSLL